MITYSFSVSGKTGGGADWTVMGETRGMFMVAVNNAIEQALLDLTDGKATFGEPGKGGCAGPYTITKFVIEEVVREPK